jgi:hypothetical protein
VILYPEELLHNGRITRKFREFHEANPEVYAKLVDLAVQLKHRGRKSYGMKSLFEVMRWHRAMTTTGSEFKLNNNYTALYARLIMHNEPRLEGFFRTRESSEQVIE